MVSFEPTGVHVSHQRPDGCSAEAHPCHGWRGRRCSEAAERDMEDACKVFAHGTTNRSPESGAAPRVNPSAGHSGQGLLLGSVGQARSRLHCEWPAVAEVHTAGRGRQAAPDLGVRQHVDLDVAVKRVPPFPNRYRAPEPRHRRSRRLTAPSWHCPATWRPGTAWQRTAWSVPGSPPRRSGFPCARTAAPPG